MKTKTLLLFSIIVLLKTLQPCKCQNTLQKFSTATLPVYVRELQHGLPPNEMKITDPKQYEFLLKRRAVLTGLLQKKVQDGKLPKEALERLNTKSPSPNIFSINQNTSASETVDLNFHLLKDINQATNSDPSNNQQSYVNNFAVLNNCVYLQADDGIHGTELWRSDGTGAGTYMVKDIVEGPSSSYPTYIIAFKNKIYFNAYSSEAGYELYQSDGTSSGTILFKDISTVDSGSKPRYFTIVKNELYFAANDSYTHSQLWKTNGTAAGTKLVKDFYAQYYSDAVTQLTAVGDSLFFTAYTAEHGNELWKSDGTAEGTVMVKDINLNDNSYCNGPTNLTALNGRLYFSAGSPRSLWVSNGTEESTKEIKNDDNASMLNSYCNFSIRQPFTIADSTLFFVASTNYTGYELYKYDPSKSAGVKLVKDITPGSGNTSITNEGLRSIKGNIYFAAPDASGNNFNLWKSGGGTGNTKIIKSFSGTFNNSSFYAVDSNLYFTAYTSHAGYEPWISDGTTSGTKLLKHINSEGSSLPAYFTACNGNVFFSAYKAGQGRELWLTKGNTENTVQVKDINKTASESAITDAPFPPFDTLNATTVIFNATTPETGSELWKSNGTESGTVLVKDLYPGEGSSNPYIIEVKNGKAYFSAYDYTEGLEGLFVTDGTDLGTKRIAVIKNSDEYIGYVHVADNGTVFFQKIEVFNDGDDNIIDLWQTDSSGFSNKVLSNIGLDFNTVGNKCFFVNYSQAHGSELWITDGTVGNAHEVADINPGSNGSYPEYFTPFKKQLVFSAYNSDATYLYASNGTSKGTIKLGNINPDIDYYPPVVFKDKLYFSASEYPDAHNNELWSTDGTASGTKLAAEIKPGPEGSYPGNFTAADNALYFTADDGIHGNELWKLSAKTLMAKLVKDITPVMKARI